MAGAMRAARAACGAFQVVLKPVAEGAYLFIFRTESSTFPDEDYFFESVGQARNAASEDFGVADADWTVWIGPSLD